MDVEKIKERIKKAFSKDNGVRLLVIIGICGIGLIYLSSIWESGTGAKNERKTEEVIDAETDREQAMEQKLARLVSAITGEESPQVLVTFESGGETVYAEDESVNTRRGDGQDDEEREASHVILKGSDGGQHALTVMEIQPEVKGVVIVSSCAGNPIVREKLTEAVKTALDISSARVYVTYTG